ncbi:MAG: hypothetical protein J7L96_09970 [Bacteroidales bacterium]|nr:hypothetical protein [Bacteroidales bacterium]
MKKLKLILGSFLLISLFASSGCAIFKGANGGATELKFSLPANQSILIDSKSKSEITTENMGQTMFISTESSGQTKVTSSGSNDEGSTLEFETLSMAQTVDSPNGSGDTDFSKLIGRKIKGTLSPKGKLGELEGLEDFPSITSAMGEPVTSEVFVQSIKQLFFVLPDGPVKKGSTWTEEISNELPYAGGKLTTKGSVEYTILEKLKVDGHNCFKIEGSGSVNTSGTFEQQGMEINLNRDSKTTSTIIFAIDKGFYLSIDNTSVTDGVVNVPAANMTIPQSIKTSSSIKATL